MKKLSKAKAPLSNGEIKEIYFGIPDNESEKKQMYQLRNNVYVKKGYIEENFYPDGLDIDEYDKNGKSSYFISTIDDKIVGTVRVIQDEYLPTEKDCFNFEEPEEMKKIPRSKRVELSRLIAIPYKKNLHTPRHLIMIGILKTITDFCKEKGYQGGYSFIKDKLKKKLDKINFPFHIIQDSKQIYQGKTLKKYFENKDDKVWPIFFLTKEIDEYFDKIPKKM